MKTKVFQWVFVDRYNWAYLTNCKYSTEESARSSCHYKEWDYPVAICLTETVDEYSDDELEIDDVLSI